ncbi:proline-rich protein HaeIII subfamily 1-like [Mustela putorius furo]|uniref:Proline-rich protein HaeIII subfamily 1-like n=1 Tax=Mustela putorius furo TaxID=9669 RepID=A0A8U0NSZ6_MUSPF|nr:proline-rich protein HaeIII subfamily 1-like [Mustela putorius furo]
MSKSDRNPWGAVFCEDVLGAAAARGRGLGLSGKPRGLSDKAEIPERGKQGPRRAARSPDRAPPPWPTTERPAHPRPVQVRGAERHGGPPVNRLLPEGKTQAWGDTRSGLTGPLQAPDVGGVPHRGLLLSSCEGPGRGPPGGWEWETRSHGTPCLFGLCPLGAGRVSLHPDHACRLSRRPGLSPRHPRAPGPPTSTPKDGQKPRPWMFPQELGHTLIYPPHALPGALPLSPSPVCPTACLQSPGQWGAGEQGPGCPRGPCQRLWTLLSAWPRQPLVSSEAHPTQLHTGLRLSGPLPRHYPCDAGL